MTAITATLLIATGWGTRYAPDVMETVVENRVAWGHLDPDLPCVGYVALVE